jgi:hypothetical protein
MDNTTDNMGVQDHKMTTPRAPNCPPGDEIAKWAWVELNYRPHAYQAIRSGLFFRHLAVSY